MKSALAWAKKLEIASRRHIVLGNLLAGSKVDLYLIWLKTSLMQYFVIIDRDI